MTPSSASWFVTGGSGLFGHAFCTLLVDAGARVTAVRQRHPVVPGVRAVRADLTSGCDVDALLDRCEATHVVHAAAITDVDRCESDEAAAEALHVDATRRLARAAARRGARFILLSTDQLWTSLTGRATEALPPVPMNAYGRTKAAGERVARDACSDALVLRTNFFGAGPSWRRSSTDRVVDVIAAGGAYRGFTDVWYTPIGLPLLCPVVAELATGDTAGILHVAGRDRVSKFEVARAVAARCGYPSGRVEPCGLAAASLPAPRPTDTSLDCGLAERLLGGPLPSIDTSIAAVYGRLADSDGSPR
jgi:dTDP-4-dehydrorhamnose reductase